MSEPRIEPSSAADINPPHPLPAPKPLGLLAWIAVYKLIKAAIAIFGAVVVFRLRGKDLVAVGHRWLIRIGLDPEGRMGASLLHPLGHFDPRRLYWTMAIFSAYAMLYCVEAVGSISRKALGRMAHRSPNGNPGSDRGQRTRPSARPNQSNAALSEPWNDLLFDLENSRG